MSTATVVTPEAGRLTRYTLRQAGVGLTRDYLMFVTEVSVTPHMWVVRGYRVTRSYVLTDDAVTESGSVDVRHEAFCLPSGDGSQCPLFSGHIPASDASRAAAAERQGHARWMA